MTDYTCFYCGNTFTPSRVGVKYCSKHCRWNMNSKRNYERNKASLNKSSAERKRVRHKHKWTYECIHCGVNLDRPNAVRKYCSDQCLIEARRIRKRANRKNWADYELRNQNNTHKRRAISYGVLYERVDRYEIFERDNWVCGICGNRVEQQFEHPHPMSASLDHVVPMSKGGHHSPDNTQCSHLDCNLRKGVDHDTEGRIDRFA